MEMTNSYTKSVLDARRKSYKEYVDLINLLIAFTRDADANIDTLVDREYVCVDDEVKNSLKANFANIKIGLSGTHTRERAVMLGKQTLVTHIAFLRDAAVADAVNTASFSKFGTDEIDKVLTLIEGTVNTDLQIARKGLYSENEITLGFFKRKLVDTIGVVIEIPVANDVQVTKYLSGVYNTMCTISNQVDILELNKAVVHAKAVVDMVSNVLSGASNVSTLGALPTEVKDANAAINENTVLDGIKQSILENGNDENTDMVAVFGKIIDQLPEMYSKIKYKVDELKTQLVDIDTKQPYIDSLNRMYSEVVEKYLQPVITEDEAIGGLSFYDKCLSTLIREENNVLTVIAETAVVCLAVLHTYTVIYAVVDKITLAGTINSDIKLNNDKCKKKD